MKIRQLNVGDAYSMSLVVLSSAVKTTKTGKPYLFLELFDGADSITANVWDWSHQNKPERNNILNLEGTITEYQGTKQLKVDFIERNKTLDISAFAPTGNVDIEEYVAKAIALIDEIANVKLQELTRKILLDNLELLKVVPGAKKVHHAFVGGTLKHIVDTAIKAKAIAATIPLCNVDLCVAGGLLHDIGKLWTYRLDGVAIDLTPEGQAFDHIALGLLRLYDYRTEENAGIIHLLQHIIASHHGKLEYGSPVTPHFMEAWVVCYADGIDAKCQTVYELNQKTSTDYTEREWSLENRSMLTQMKVTKILEG